MSSAFLAELTLSLTLTTVAHQERHVNVCTFKMRFIAAAMEKTYEAMIIGMR